jgi:phosphonate transport system ATP-binding protein
MNGLTGEHAPVLELSAVGKSFGELEALKGINLTVSLGERVAILGPSGSGKSTLIQLLAGALQPSCGKVLFQGQDMTSWTRRELRSYRRRLGLVEQSLDLVPQLSLHRNVIAGLLPNWSPRRILFSLLWTTDKQRVGQMLDEVGLASRQFDPTHTLSGGEKQRVAIARALIHNPAILFADEPTSSLDPATAETVVRLLIEKGQRHAQSMILSTHWASVVQPHVDRIIGLREGRIVLDAPAQEVTDAMLDDLYAGHKERR